MAAREDHRPVLVGLHVAVLGAFAVSQPLFELVARHVEFLVAHQVGSVDIAWIALGLGLGIPGLLAAVAFSLATLIGPKSHAVTGCWVALGLAAIVLPGLESMGTNIWLEFGTAAALGIVAAIAYLQVAPVRSIVTLLAPALLLFPALFYWNVGGVVSDTRSWAPVAAGSVRPQSDARVVVVVFDALPLNSLLSDEGSIDPVRHPHFAALAERATWYHNATTVAERTTYALPAILTGQYPDQVRVATAAEYPENLFTLLATDRSLNVIEPFTRLCPPELCDADDSRGERLELIASDLLVLYLNRLLPDGASETLPDVTTTWKNFAGGLRSDGIRRRRADAGWIFEQFLDRIADRGSLAGESRPALHFIHVNLPHRPYRYLPSGVEYGPMGSFGVAHGARKGVWQDDAWEVTQALQRHLLQLRYADALLGRLIETLERVGSFDDSLIVVTADHGINFRTGTGMRQVDRKNPERNAADIMRVPLFVKWPGQGAPLRSDRNVETIDILPTIIDALGGRVPKLVDGVALGQAESAHSRAGKVIYVRDGSARVALRVDADLPLGESVARRLGLTSQADLFAIGTRLELHGRPAAALDVLDPSGVEIRLIDAAAYAEVDPDSRFLPVHVTGEILLANESGPLELAVAINGVIRATTRTYAHEPGAHEPGRARFSSMVAPDAYRAGGNTVEIFVIRDRTGRVALESTDRRPHVDYFGVVGAAGQVEAIGSSDGRIFPVVPGAVAGQVRHGGAYFEGEAIDAKRDRAAESVLVFAGGRLLHVQQLTPTRRDGDGKRGDDGGSPDLPKHRRFRLMIPYGKLDGESSAHVQFIGLTRGAASWIGYSRPNSAPSVVLGSASSSASISALDSRAVDPPSAEHDWLGPIGSLALERRGDREGLSIGATWLPIDSAGGKGVATSKEGEDTPPSVWIAESQNQSGALLIFADGQFVDAVRVEPAEPGLELELPNRGSPGTRLLFLSDDGSAAELSGSSSQ